MREIKTYRKTIMRLLRIPTQTDLYTQVCIEISEIWREVMEEGKK